MGGLFFCFFFPLFFFREGGCAEEGWGWVGGGLWGEGYIINIIISPPVGSKNASGRGNVNNVKSLYSKNLIPAGEMLIMLIMLNHTGDSWENSKMDLTLLTLLTFPLWEAKNASGRGNVNNVNNVKSL